MEREKYGEGIGKKRGVCERERKKRRKLEGENMKNGLGMRGERARKK